jgi:ribose 5-phosphate isomerase A
MSNDNENLDDQTKLKKRAGEKAAEYVKDGMVVGLGTGSTVEFTIKKLGERVKSGTDIVGIPTSIRSEELARELGIKLTTLLDHPVVDLTIDGADEVHKTNLNLIKGLGGALTREKIVAACSKKEIIVVDDLKMVDVLGTKAPVPVEVLRFAWNTCKTSLEQLGSKPELRLRDDDQKPYITDNDCYILDCRFDGIQNPQELEAKINTIPGVLENGLFLKLTDMVIVASKTGIKTLTN